MYRAGRIVGGESEFRALYLRATERCMAYFPGRERQMISIVCALLTARRLLFFDRARRAMVARLARAHPHPVARVRQDERLAGLFRVLGGDGFGRDLRAARLRWAAADPGPDPFINIPSLLFAVAVVGARWCQRALGSVAAMFAFAALWTAFDFFVSLGSSNGSVGTPAAAEVGMPLLIQTASLVGFLGITFLLGLVSAGIAASLRAGGAFLPE